MDTKQTHQFQPSEDLKPVRHQLLNSFQLLPNIDHDFPKQLQHQRKLSEGTGLNPQICHKILCCCGNYLTLGLFFSPVSQLEDKEKDNSRCASETQSRQEQTLTQSLSEESLHRQLEKDSNQLVNSSIPSESTQLIPVTPTSPGPLSNGTGDLVSSEQISFDSIHVKVEKCDTLPSRKFVPHHPSSGKSSGVRSKHGRTGENSYHHNERYQRNRRSRSPDRDRRRDKGRRGESFVPSHDRRGDPDVRDGKRKSSDGIQSTNPRPVKTARESRDSFLGLALNEFLKSSCPERGCVEESK
jgi:hypothetical protein